MNIVRGRYAGGWVIFLLSDVMPAPSIEWSFFTLTDHRGFLGA